MFFVTEHNGDMVILPIEHFAKYFNVTATYRIKKSGSTNPSKNNFAEIQKIVNDSNVQISKDGKYTYVQSTKNLDENKLQGDKYTYYFKLADKDKYVVTRLSNTHNANVIFSITLKQGQDPADLKQFINALKK